MSHIGTFLFSAVFGFLVGASNTPVTGVLITAIFGLIGAMWGTIFFTKKSVVNASLHSALGFSMILVSFGFISGVLMGEKHRLGWKNVEKQFVWEGSKPPYNTYESIDWIVITEKLLKAGYRFEDIKEIYNIRLEERQKLELMLQSETLDNDDYFSPTVIYDESNPYSDLLGKV